MWPAAVVVVVLVLRKPLRHVIESLRSLTYKEATLAFEQQIKRVAVEADRAELLPAVVPPVSATTPSETSTATESQLRPAFAPVG